MRAAAPGNPCTPERPNTAAFTGDANRVGLVDLYFFLAYGVKVSYFECVAGRANLLGERSEVVHGVLTPFYGATQWRCDRLVRTFAATATLADGTAVEGTTNLRTMSCARRFALELPRRLAPGQATRVRVVDRWAIGGIHTQLCFTPPRGRRACEGLGFRPAVGAVSRRFRPTRRGVWVVSLQVRADRVQALVAVGVAGARPPPALPTVLATGDSTIEGVDSFLADDLGGRASVVSDARLGFAISSADGWAAVAAAQVARLRPDVTVISLGANEGFPMRGADGAMHACCDEAWVAEYTRRVRKIMLIYSREGRGRVVYLTIAAPRVASHVPITIAVDTAIVRAAAGLRGVAALRMDLLFSPHGYQDVIRYRGRDVNVREPDGVHLNVAGTAIEAQQAATALGRLR